MPTEVTRLAFLLMYWFIKNWHSFPLLFVASCFRSVGF